MQHTVKQVAAEQPVPQGFTCNLQSFAGRNPDNLGLSRTFPDTYSLSGIGTDTADSGSISTSRMSLARLLGCT